MTDRQSARRVAFPPLGVLSLVAEKYLQILGMQVVLLPPTSQRTLDIGIRNTPETLCVPCKLLFGNYVEAAERGANEIVMLGGAATCRLGYSVAQHVQRLEAMGFAVRAHTLDLNRLWQDMLRLTAAFGQQLPVHELIGPLRFLFTLLDLTDELERSTLHIRPLERERGATERAYAAALVRITALQDRQQLDQEKESILEQVRSVSQVEQRPLLRVGLVGDLYTILTPFMNHNLEVELGRMGVEVQRWFQQTAQIYVPLPRPLPQTRWMRAVRAGSSYLSREVGGFAMTVVGEAALMVEEHEVDGLIHVAPFNCTPEIVAQGALVALQREKGVPVLNLSFDEQTGRAGVMTRLEAFVDMLWAARRRGR
jgi:predicted nucleotide-binding protein (sugar kinase/HSP70/actin superfamily)